MGDFMELTFLLTTITGILIYLFLVWNFGYWKKRNVNGPKPRPLFGNMPSMITQSRNFIEDLNDIYKKYKGKENFIGLYAVRTPQLFVIEPNLIREVFITNFKCFNANEFGKFADKETDPLFSRNPFMLVGDEWKDKRSEITPALTTNRIKVMYPVMQDVCNKMIKYLEIETGNPPTEGINVKELSSKYTVEVVSNCIYGIEANAFSPKECVIHKMAKKLFDMNIYFILYFTILSIFPSFRNIYKLPIVSKKTEQFFIKLMIDAKKLRLENKNDRADFLNYLIQLEEKKNLSPLEMAAHSLTFFLDGFETSSIVITHCLHMIAKHPDVQARLRLEIEKAASESGEIEFDKLSDLPYLDQCFNETLRLFPPLMVNGKICTESTVFTNLKGQKIDIFKDDVLEIPIYSIHHDEEYYPNPEEFIPDRFSPENGGIKKFKDMGVFLTFGDGPRICLGMKFGLTQSKAAVVEIIRNYQISVNPKTRKDFKLDPKQFFCMLDGGIWLDFKRLKN